MDRNRDKRLPLVGISWWVVRVAMVVNRLFLGAVILGLLGSWLFAAGALAFLARSNPGVDAVSELAGLRCEMALGVAMAIATDRVLATLAVMIASARAGDPFVAANARRLQAIGWWLLALQLLDLPGAWLARLFPALGAAAPDPSFSPGGWLAVLMVFVLARVFAAGAAMRDELAGTI